MDTAFHRGNHGNICDTAEKAMKGKIRDGLQLAIEVGWRSKENETKIPFQSCGNRASELQMTTGENQSKIQVILNDEGHTPHTTHTTRCSNKLVLLVDVTDRDLVNTQQL
jgi:hypothetical protein